MDFIQLGPLTPTSSFEQLRGGVQLSGADAQLLGTPGILHFWPGSSKIWDRTGQDRAGQGKLLKHKGRPHNNISIPVWGARGAWEASSAGRALYWRHQGLGVACCLHFSEASVSKGRK